MCAKKNCCALIGSATVSSAKRATFRVENLVKLSCRKDYSAGPKTGGALLKRERGSELRQGDEKNWEEERRKRAMRDSSLAPALTLAAAPRSTGDPTLATQTAAAAPLCALQALSRELTHMLLLVASPHLLVMILEKATRALIVFIQLSTRHDHHESESRAS